MSSIALAVEKVRASGNNIKLLVPHKITNLLHITTGSRTITDSTFIKGEISSKLELAFVKSTSAIGYRTSCPHKFEQLGLFSLVCKVNRIPFYNLSFDKSYKAL